MRLRKGHFNLLMILGIVTTASSWSCGAFRFSNQQPTEPVRQVLAVDTTVVIIRVFNYQPTEVTVFLDTRLDRQRIGTVTAMHEAFFVLPSATVVALNEFTLIVVPVEEGIKPYRTGLIARNPNRITMVYVAVGEQANRNQPGGYLNSAPNS